MNLDSPGVAMLWLSSFCVFLASFCLVYRVDISLLLAYIRMGWKCLDFFFLRTVFADCVSVFNYISVWWLTTEKCISKLFKISPQTFLLVDVLITEEHLQIRRENNWKGIRKKVIQILRWNQLSTWYLKKEKTIVCKML